MADLSHPAHWGNLLGANPVKAAAAWADRLRGREAANAVRGAFAAIARNPCAFAAGGAHVAKTGETCAQVAGLRLRGLALRAGLWTAEVQADAGDRTANGTADRPDTGPDAAAEATAAAYLSALRALGVPVAHDGSAPPSASPTAREVALATGVLRALSRRPVAGAIPRFAEAWRLCGARSVDSIGAGRLYLPAPAGRFDSLAVVHWDVPTPLPAPAVATTCEAWAAAARRAAAQAGLVDALTWGFAAAFRSPRRDPAPPWARAPR